MTEQPKAFPSIQGRCPACRGDSLFIGSGGYVTCSRLACPNPSAADELLHGDHVTAATPLVCSDERHTAKVTALEAELARLHEGEEPVTNPAVMHTPAQWIWQWNRATLEQRLQVVEAAMRDGAAAHDCRINGHTERIHDGRHAEMALNEVRQTVADMEATTGARTWAGWLRDAMKRGPKACLLCATGQKTEPAPPAPAATETPDPTHGLSVQHADALWDAIAAPGPDRPPYMVQHERVCRATAGILREQPFQTVRGRCPACGNTLLFVGDDGHVTCSLDECPNPSAADQLLHAEPAPAGTEETGPVQQADAYHGDPPVQCWHTEPGTPCDWDVCNQPERLAAGDYGTDPREQQ